MTPEALCEVLHELEATLAAYRVVVRELATSLEDGHASYCGSAREPCKWAEHIEQLLAHPLVVAARTYKAVKATFKEEA